MGKRQGRDVTERSVSPNFPEHSTFPGPPQALGTSGRDFASSGFVGFLSAMESSKTSVFPSCAFGAPSPLMYGIQRKGRVATVSLGGGSQGDVVDFATCLPLMCAQGDVNHSGSRERSPIPQHQHQQEAG